MKISLFSAGPIQLTEEDLLLVHGGSGGSTMQNQNTDHGVGDQFDQFNEDPPGPGADVPAVDSPGFTVVYGGPDQSYGDGAGS
jgi:hypothetical protein